MPETYEKDGIVFFVEPYKANKIDWIYDHLDCDTVYREDEKYSNTVYIICYAKDSKYNEKLYEVKKNSYQDDILMRGVSSREVGGIV